jgi:hypothetical protein
MKKKRRKKRRKARIRKDRGIGTSVHREIGKSEE